ncbi:unnamed protein product [Paramecium sonneborni]|uniref:Ankyrin repeat protein n=1 Tax=Paramecium sonneborni TaxID=65129 RepID=A0A8S1M6R1_9CILI|nr:unnamed protein product [Paramecium sonneborni]
MIKRNLKWRINSQRENSTPKPKSISIESPRHPTYLIRRETKSRNSQLKNPLSTYTKYVFHSNQISPVSSPNTSKIFKQEEQQINSPTNNYNQERKHSLSTLSTENRSFKHKLSINNRQFQTESIKLTTQQYTEQNIDMPIDNQVIQQQIDIECSNIDMQQKKISCNYIFDDKKKKKLKQKMQQFQSKEQKKSSTLIDQVIKLIRTIKQPSYRYEAHQRSSRIWQENACFETVKLKQNYTYSQSQFKFYFSQYFDKHLKFYRILEINNQLLQLMNNHQQITKDLQEQRKAVFIDKIYSDAIIEHYKAENLFRFKDEIKTYGMIDFLNENSQISISINHSNSELNRNDKNQSQIEEDDSELFKLAKVNEFSNLTPIKPEQNISLKSYQFQLTHIISELDKKSKNKLLSVDYTIIDQKIYRDNINQIVPTFQEEYSEPTFFKVYKQFYNEIYKDILNGNFGNLNPIDDIEFEAPILEPIQNGNVEKENKIDKKNILYSLRQQKNWLSGFLQKQTQPISEFGFHSHRATIQVFSSKQSSEAGSPQLPQINILQQSSDYQKMKKNIHKSIHNKNALSPKSPGQRDKAQSFQQTDFLLKNQNDISQDSVGEINKITMSKSQQQLPKPMLDINLQYSKIFKKTDSGKNFKEIKMVQSIKSDIGQQDSMSDSVNFNIQQIQLQNKGANPQNIKLETMLLYDQMLKKNRSKKKIASILIEHGLLNQFQEFMDVHRNFNLNGQTQDGIPFISLAAANGHEGVIKHMLNFDVNLNQMDLDGNTPLYYALVHNNFEIADLLIQNGANPYIKNQGK